MSKKSYSNFRLAWKAAPATGRRYPYGDGAAQGNTPQSCIGLSLSPSYPQLRAPTLSTHNRPGLRPPALPLRGERLHQGSIRRLITSQHRRPLSVNLVLDFTVLGFFSFLNLGQLQAIPFSVLIAQFIFSDCASICSESTQQLFSPAKKLLRLVLG